MNKFKEFIKGAFTSKAKILEEVNQLEIAVGNLTTAYCDLSKKYDELLEKHEALVKYNKEVMDKTNEIIMKPYLNLDESEEHEKWKIDQEEQNNSIFEMFGWGDRY